MPGMPALVPTKLEMKTTEPPPRFNIAGIWLRTLRNAEVRLAVIPFLYRNLRKRFCCANGTGIVDGDIETAKDGHGRIRQTGMGFRNCDVTHHGVNTTAGLANGGSHVLECLGTTRVDNDGRALFGKQPCRRPADAG